MAKQPREPDFARPTVGVQMPQDDGLFGEGLSDGAPTAEPEDPMLGWAPFPEPPTPGRYGQPPYDHAPVALTPDGVAVAIGQWQTSRRWAGTAAGKRWEPYGFWAMRATGGRPIGFEPKGWREWRS